MKIMGVFFSAVLLLLISSSAIAVPPVPYGPNVNYVHMDPWIDCSVFPEMEHTLGVEYWVSDYGRMHFDNEGNLLRINGFTEMILGISWNSDDPDNPILTTDDVAGGNEHSHYTVLFDEYGKDVLYRESGIFYKATLPGYGLISINAGSATWIWDYDLMMWVPENITPNRNHSEEGLYELCLYHLQ